MRSLFLILCSLCFTVQAAFAQTYAVDSAGIAYARQIYVSSLGDQSGIYDGVEYTGYPHTIKDGTPFFLRPESTPGNIVYDGLAYNNIPMWYDIGKNQVVVQYIDNHSRLVLHPEKISSFSIGGHTFIKLDTVAARSVGLAPGFYDQIYSGASRVVVKRSKSFVIKTDAEGVWVNLSNQKNDIYLWNGTGFRPVSSLKSVLKVLGKHEKELQAYLRQNKTKFNRQRESAIVMIVSQFDQLSGGKG